MLDCVHGSLTMGMVRESCQKQWFFLLSLTRGCGGSGLEDETIFSLVRGSSEFFVSLFVDNGFVCHAVLGQQCETKGLSAR